MKIGKNGCSCQIAALSRRGVVDTISHFEKLNFSTRRNLAGLQKWLFQSVNTLMLAQVAVALTISLSRVRWQYALSAARRFRLTLFARTVDFTWAES